MKFIKVFDTDSEYLSFRDGGGYEKPNVSLSRYTKVVHYNYPIWDNNGHDYVDLGLPSGTLWATCNVGADKPSDYGLYFQWGDTVGYTYDQVGKDGYKWNPSGDGQTFTKYTIPGDKLELEDDAANKNMGGDWHMPTKEQIQELLDNTDLGNWASGWYFVSKINSRSIFIPVGMYTGFVLSSMLSMEDNATVPGINVYSSGANIEEEGRVNGSSVRGVLG